MTRHRRAIGPVASAARVAGGLAAIVLSIIVSGVTWWDVGVALVALPVTAIIAAAAVTASYRRYATGRAHPLVAESWIRSALVLALVVGVEIALSFATPLDGAVAIWIFIGLSVLVAAVRGDAGCEAVAIPNALAGRSDPTGCVVYAAIDAAEARRARASATGQEYAGRPGEAHSARRR